MDRGPWVIGEAVFQGRDAVSPYALRNRVRARPGTLYTPTDISVDLGELESMPSIRKATAALYGMPLSPVPDNFRSISVSTMMVRVVYTIEEIAVSLPGLRGPATGQAKAGAALEEPPVSLSGVIMTPTAYRGIDQYNSPGLGFDVNATYFIGRLYGKNSLSTEQTNFIDRVGVWFLSADGKMQIQSEGRWRPAMAVGARGVFTFRDAPQPSVTGPTVSTKVTADTTRSLSDAYIVLSKKVWKARTSLGYAQGNAGDRISLLSEFLTPASLKFLSGAGETEAKSKDVFFGSILLLPKPQFPLAVEFLKPNGMVLNPILINFKIGYFLKLNFDLAYLRFNGGWDLLGTFQFRYTHFPRGRKKKQRPQG